MSEWTQQEVDQTLEEIKRRAITDPEFRQIALVNANAAIAQVNPKPIPDTVSIKFADNTGTLKTIVLPDPIAAADELSDAELEEVAGGDNSNNTNVKVKVG
jgi:hypothetical protein